MLYRGAYKVFQVSTELMSDRHQYTSSETDLQWGGPPAPVSWYPFGPKYNGNRLQSYMRTAVASYVEYLCFFISEGDPGWRSRDDYRNVRSYK